MSLDQAFETAENAEMIRCVSIIGLQGHGKTELCDWLIARSQVGKSQSPAQTACAHTPRGSMNAATRPSASAVYRQLRMSQDRLRVASKAQTDKRDSRIERQSIEAETLDFRAADVTSGDIGHTRVHSLLHLYTPNAAATVPYSIEGLRQATMKKEGKNSRVVRPRHTQALLEPGIPLAIQHALMKSSQMAEGNNDSRRSSLSADEEGDRPTPLTISKTHVRPDKVSPARAATATPTSGLRETSISLELPKPESAIRSSLMTRCASSVDVTPKSSVESAARQPRRCSTTGTLSTIRIHPEPGGTNPKAKKEEENGKKRKSKMARFSAPSALLVYAFDTPGHADYAADVAASLRLSDGAVVVVDAVQGCTSHLEVLLRQALAERVRPTLFVSGLERCILEQKMAPEDIHKRMRSIVDSMNDAVDSHKDELLGDVCICPDKGDAAFGSTSQGWAFSIHNFADLYYTKFGLDRSDLARRLWEEDPGDDLLSDLPVGIDRRDTRVEMHRRALFHNAKRGVQQQNEEGHSAGANGFETNSELQSNATLLACDIGAPVKATSKPQPQARSLLCSLILSPLCQLAHTLMGNDSARQQDLLNSLGVELSESERFFRGEELVQCVFARWLGAAEAVLEMVRLQLPSPKEAQRYRVENLYGGPVDDAAATAVRDCDPEGPMMTFVSRMLPKPDGGLYALGRVFSGKLISKRPVWVRSLGRSKRDGVRVDDAQELHSIECVAMPFGFQAPESMPQASCGNVVAIFGVDQFILKAGTLTDLEDATDIADLQFSTVRPVVRVAVKPVEEAALPRLTDALRRLSKVDPLAECAVEEWGEHILVGSGRYHLDECLTTLKADLAPEQLVIANPVGAGKEGAHDSYHVVYRETVRDKGVLSTARTPNQLCELSAVAEPLSESLCSDLEAGMLQLRRLGEEERLHTFVDHYNWSRADVARIWCYGPGESGANFVVDGTDIDVNSSREPHHLEVQGAVTAACQWATREGGLCEETMRGVRFTLRDVALHAEHLQRGTGQIIGAARRSFLAAELSAAPCLQEPFFLCEVVCEEGPTLDAVRKLLMERHGEILEESQVGCGGSIRIAVQMKTADSLGLDDELERVGCHCHVQTAFSHWERVPGDPASPGHHRDLILALRRWRQLKAVIPTPDEFLGPKAMIAPADIFVDELSDLSVSLGRAQIEDDSQDGLWDSEEGIHNGIGDEPDDL